MRGPNQPLLMATFMTVLHLLVDTSTWLDLAKRRDGQKWIVSMRLLIHEGQLLLYVPQVVVDEFERNRTRIAESMTASVSERFRQIKRDIESYGGSDSEEAAALIDGLAHQVPLIGAMTTRNFDDILALLKGAGGLILDPGADERERVVERALDKRAPFHRSRNSVADALLFELYATAARTADLALQPHAFVTTNSNDFSRVNGDQREPHPDLAEAFDGAGSRYALGVEGLFAIMRDHFGEELEELLEETDFVEEPRRLDEIMAAETEMFDRIWYHRSLMHEYRLEDEGKDAEIQRLRLIAGNGRKRVEATYTEPGQLGPYTDFELGMLNGKMSALRWVLGSEWDFLDT